MNFSLTTTKFNNSKTYSSLNIKRDLYTIYKDFFIKVYLNSYLSNNKIQRFIMVNDIADNCGDITNGRKVPHIRYDLDGVMVCNGKRCEKEQLSKEEDEEIERCMINIE